MRAQDAMVARTFPQPSSVRQLTAACSAATAACRARECKPRV